MKINDLPETWVNSAAPTPWLDQTLWLPPGAPKNSPILAEEVVLNEHPNPHKVNLNPLFPRLVVPTIKGHSASPGWLDQQLKATPPPQIGWTNN